MLMIVNVPDNIYKKLMQGELPIYMAYKYVKDGIPLNTETEILFAQKMLNFKIRDKYLKEGEK